jgi:hypothetical protein
VTRYERIVAGYLAHADAVAYDRPDSHYWAYVLLHRLAERRPEKAWPLVVEVVTRTLDPVILNYVAADILEDLICEHGAVVVDRVEELARTDGHFRSALTDVWGWNRMAPEVRRRLDAAVPEAWARYTQRRITTGLDPIP